MCVLHERFFDLEFRVISTSIESLEDRVLLPHFHGCSRGGDRATGIPRSDSRIFAVGKHVDHAIPFVAMITLSRFIRRADEVIHSYEPNLSETELLWQESDGSSHSDLLSIFHHLKATAGCLGNLLGNYATSLTVGVTRYRNAFNGVTVTELI
jgi:hypothetical protein